MSGLGHLTIELETYGGYVTGKQLKKWRLRMDWSQSETATAMGISLRQYARYEAGEWPVPTLVELATRALTPQADGET
jgi:predicted transcriptional regulator